MSVYTNVNLRHTEQTERADARQVLNSAGGYSFELDAASTARRFLILGTTAGTFYATPRAHTAEAVESLRAAIVEMGVGFVDLIVEVSDGGLAKSNTEALFALALAASADDTAVRSAAFAALPKVARTGTHLFEFVTYARQFRGMGRSLKRAIASWYTERSAASVANQMVKYQARKVGNSRVSHKTLLGLTRPVPPSDAHRLAFGWAVGKVDGDTGLSMIDGYRAAHADGADVAKVIAEFQLPFEAVPSQALVRADVWEALLPYMGMTALLRNLGKLTSLGVIQSSVGKDAVARLVDVESLRDGRIHPMAVLFALRAYTSGRGRSGLTWAPRPSVTDALDEAFRLAFQSVTPTGKRRLIALDVSGSMASAFVHGSTLSARDASAAMALVTLATDPDTDVVGFSDGLVPLPLSGRQRLDDAIRAVSRLPFDHTDCAQPMLWAAQHGKVYDSFEVYTDSETWAGRVHPHQALRDYRAKFNPQARLVVVGMTATNFTIADPADRGALDVVGFDASAPAMIGNFVAGRV